MCLKKKTTNTIKFNHKADVEKKVWMWMDISMFGSFPLN